MYYRVTGDVGYPSHWDYPRLIRKNFDIVVTANTSKDVPTIIAEQFRVSPENVRVTKILDLFTDTGCTFKESLTLKLEECIKEDPVENTYKTVKEYLAEQGFEIETTRGWLYPSRWVLNVDYKFKVQVDLIYNDKDTFNLSVKADSKYLKAAYIKEFIDLNPESVLGTIKHCLFEIGDLF